MLRIATLAGEREYHDYDRTTSLLWSILTDNTAEGRMRGAIPLSGDGFEIVNHAYSRVRDRYQQISDPAYTSVGLTAEFDGEAVIWSMRASDVN